MLNQWSHFVCGLFSRPARKRQQRSSSLHIEGLEDRQMLTAGIIFDTRPNQTIQPDAKDLNLVHFHFKGVPNISQINFAAVPGASTTAITHVNLLAGTQIIATDQSPNDGLNFGLTKTTLKLIKKNGATVLADARADAQDGATIQYALSSFTPVKARQKITVTGGPNPTFTVDAPDPATGNLYVTPTVGTFGLQYVQLGTLDKPIAAFDLRAEGEDVSLTTFTLFVPGHPASIDRLELYDAPDAVTPFATAVKTSGSPFAGYDMYTATLTVGSFVVEDGATEAIYVRPRLRSDVDGGVTNEPISVDLLGAVGTSVTAVGMESSNQLQVNDEDSSAEGEMFIGVGTAGANQNANGNPNTTVGAEPITFESVDPNPNGTNIPVGVSRILAIRIKAAPNTNTQNGLDKVVINRFTATIFTSNIALDDTSFRFYNLTDPSIKIVATTVVQISPGVYGVQFDGLASSNVDTRIPSGGDITVAVEVNITNPKVSNAQTSSLLPSASLSDFGFGWVVSDAVGTSVVFNGVDNGQQTTVNGTAYLS